MPTVDLNSASDPENGDVMRKLFEIISQLTVNFRREFD